MRFAIFGGRKSEGWNGLARTKCDSKQFNVLVFCHKIACFHIKVSQKKKIKSNQWTILYRDSEVSTKLSDILCVLEKFYSLFYCFCWCVRVCSCVNGKKNCLFCYQVAFQSWERKKQQQQIMKLYFRSFAAVDWLFISNVYFRWLHKFRLNSFRSSSFSLVVLFFTASAAAVCFLFILINFVMILNTRGSSE